MQRAAAAGSNGSNRQAVLAGSDAFLLYDSFGFPLEFTHVGWCVWGGGYGERGDKSGVGVRVQGAESA